MIAFPKKITLPCPAVVIPFYFPEAMLGFDPVTGETLSEYTSISMMEDLVNISGRITPVGVVWESLFRTQNFSLML
ncbi:MAG: hypothetical protein E7473_03675 [Ruminococcaceae bacterium]|nr:hypothetical protein [Oscillospiraceae bacterium]